MTVKNVHPLTTFVIKRHPVPGEEFTVIYSEVGKPLAEGLRWSFVPVPGDDVPDEPDPVVNLLTGQWVAYSNGQMELVLKDSGFTVNLTQPGSNNQVYQTLPLQDTTYRLSFLAAADRPLTGRVRLIQHNKPYANQGLNEPVQFPTATGRVEFTFTGQAEPAARLQFQFGEPGVYALRDIVLEML